MSIIHPTKSRAAGLAGYGALALGLFGFLGVAPAPPAPASPRGQSTAATTGHSPRVDRLLAQMTLDDKLQMVSGGPEPNATNQYEAGYLPGIARLGIPGLRLTDGRPVWQPRSCPPA
jgi:beta-glucosidase